MLAPLCTGMLLSVGTDAENMAIMGTISLSIDDSCSVTLRSLDVQAFLAVRTDWSGWRCSMPVHS